jgi:5-methylcytosine-specific restriction endonuclease McrA
MPRTPNHDCHICSTPVYIRPSTLAKSKSGKAFCSNECYGKFCQIQIPCAVCGNPMLSGKNAKTCSRACANKQKVGLRYKQLGRSTKDVVRDHRALKTKLINKVGSACERCKYDEVPEVLHAHHIIERCLGGRDELDNLELLCPTCHDVEHFRRRQAKKLMKTMLC